jgi:hypothetical protein
MLEAAKRAAPLLPAQMREEFDALLSKESAAILAATFTVWAGSHALGFGVIVDGVLLVAGVAMLGWQAVSVAQDIASFVTICIGATTEPELDTAARHLARAVSVMGVAAFTALLTKSVARRAGGSPNRVGRQSPQPVPQRPAPGRRSRPSRPVEPERPGSLPAARQKPTRPIPEQMKRMAAAEGSGSIAVVARRQLVEQHLRNRGQPLEKIEQILRATDLSKPVRLVEIPPGGLGPEGRQLARWEAPGSGGSFYTTDLKAKPSDLGVHHKSRVRGRGVVEKERVLYEVPKGKKVIGLESTSAAVDDTWSVSGQAYPTRGGATQIQIFDRFQQQPPSSLPFK